MMRIGTIIVVLCFIAAGVVIYYSVKPPKVTGPAPIVQESSTTTAEEKPTPKPQESPMKVEGEVYDAIHPARAEALPPEEVARQYRTGAELIRDALSAEKGGDTAKMVELLERAMKEAPNSPQVQKAVLKLVPAYLSQNRLWEARNALSLAIQRQDITEEERSRLAKRLEELNDKLIFSREPSKDSVTFEVKPGDTLDRIAKKFNVTAGLLARINRLEDPRKIFVGQRLKVIKGPFDVVVEKSKFRLSVYLHGRFVREYPIGLGKNNSTPAGSFVVTNKLKEPTWTEPETRKQIPYPDNPLGTRWIGFYQDYGIHGTWEPESIGKTVSAGCIRMLNPDVEELFDLVASKEKVAEPSKVVVRP